MPVLDICRQEIQRRDVGSLNQAARWTETRGGLIESRADSKSRSTTNNPVPCVDMSVYRGERIANINTVATATRPFSNARYLATLMGDPSWMSTEISWILTAPLIIRSKKGIIMRRELANNAARWEPQAETCTIMNESEVHAVRGVAYNN